MRYAIKAWPTFYDGVQMRSRLEAKWAAFFDLVKWRWEYEPIDLENWSPDFRVTFGCDRCEGFHTLLVEVKPYYCLEEFSGHPCTLYPNGVRQDGARIPAHAPGCELAKLLGEE